MNKEFFVRRIAELTGLARMEITRTQPSSVRCSSIWMRQGKTGITQLSGQGKGWKGGESFIIKGK